MVDGTASFLDSCADSDAVKERINERVNELYNTNADGDLIPYVCAVCDEFILSRNEIDVLSIAKMKASCKLLSWSSNFSGEERIGAIEAFYKFPEYDDLPRQERRSWLDEMALSPRGSLKQMHVRQARGFVVCKRCRECLCKKRGPVMPPNAIANKKHVGCPPQELLELNDIERSFLTPIRSYGYFFTFEGGHMKQMRGSMTFMRVEERSLAKSVATLESMGLTKHVIVMTSGPMTEGQQEKAKKQSEFRTDKMIVAVKWLCENHRMWKDVNLKNMIQEIGKTNPIRVEKASTVHSGNAVLEEEVVFTCYYPDGATNASSGGFNNREDFKAFVEEMREKHYDVQFKAEIEREFVTCSDGDHLIGACLLQFPYGVGSLNETRLLEDGKLTSKSDLSEFLSHLSKKSDPLFQRSLFQLIMYSMKNKGRLLKSSCLQLKQKFDAKTLAEGFNHKDFSKACKGRRNRMRRGSRLSNKVLDAVDATARDLPHTDRASKRARSTMESMFHHLGMGSVFLTVTFDDENSLLIQILSDIQIDEGECIADLSDDELEKRAKRREKLRYNFPGIAALSFEILLKILLEEVLCWDIENDEPIQGKQGLFGDLGGVAFAVEEQGRKTLHVHFILWILGYQGLQKALFFGNEKDKKDAEGTAQKYYDHLASTKLFPTVASELLKAFDHEDCPVKKKDRQPPTVVANQELRYLRYKKGYEYLKGEFASCPHCTKVWTYEQLITDYIQQGEGIRDMVSQLNTNDLHRSEEAEARSKKVLPRPRMLAKIVQFQHPSHRSDAEPTMCINASYQAHASCHHKNCFNCRKLKGNKKRKHVCGSKCECRYRLPDKKRKHTTIKTEREGAAWIKWTGEFITQPLVQFLPARNKYDLFQNVACKAILNSKFTCNSNVSCITDSPIAMYTCKYINKPTENDDTMEYSHVDATMKKLGEEGPKHENHKSEALRMICRAAFAHNKHNVISASMASYLTRHDSRFYFSHQFVYCPLKDVLRLHNQQEIGATLAMGPSGTSFFENQALHYLCRPQELEQVSLKVFTEQYEVGYVRRKDKERPFTPFQVDTGAFKHPSATWKGRGKKKQLQCTQGVREREINVLIKVLQFGFPDTSQFHENMLTCDDSKLNRAMNEYAQMVLTLLLWPHWSTAQLESTQATEYTFVETARDLRRR